MLKIYPIPKTLTASPAFTVTINGKAAECYSARVSRIPFNRVWPGFQRPAEQTELASLLTFDADEPCEIHVVPHRDFEEAIIRPLSKGIIPEREGESLVFEIMPGDQLSLELDGYHENLHIFCNPIEEEPSLDTPQLRYFGPGVHDAGLIELKDNDYLYLAGGAFVYGGISVVNARNVRIGGHGILSNAAVTRTGLAFPACFVDHANMMLPEALQSVTEHKYAAKMPSLGCLRVTNSENVRVEGIVMMDSAVWTATITNSREVHFDNVKAIGMWRYNSDGIDFCNSQKGSVRRSFLRNYDDVIVVKGLKPSDTQNTEDLIFEKNVIWCDWGRGLEIGAETCADEIKNIVSRDTDIIHGTHIHMDIQNGDRGDVHDILYDNIRVEYSRYEVEPIYQATDDMEYLPKEEPNMPCLFLSEVRHGMWSQDTASGKVHDICLKDIDVTTDEDLPLPKCRLIGTDEDHATRNVTLENVRINGMPLTEESVEKDKFSENIVIR